MSAADIATIGECQPQTFEVCILRISQIGSTHESAIAKFLWRRRIDESSTQHCKWTTSSIIGVETAIDDKPLSWEAHITTRKRSSISNECRINPGDWWVDDDISALTITVLTSDEEEDFVSSSVFDIGLDVNIATFYDDGFRASTSRWGRNIERVHRWIDVVIITTAIRHCTIFDEGEIRPVEGCCCPWS